MKPNSLDAFYEALAPGPGSTIGVLPPPDMEQGVGHFNVFSDWRELVARTLL